MAKSNGFFKGVATVLAAVILAGGVCAVGYVSRDDSGKWFRESDIKSWAWNKSPNGGFNDDGNIQTSASTGGAVVSDSVNTDGLALRSVKIAANEYDVYGISTYADTAYILTATIQPAEATDKTVTYSCSWENANSTWASGKNVLDYVKVTQTSTGSLTANLTCLQAFGEPIVVTCTSNDNPAAKAYVNVNYIKRLIDTVYTTAAMTLNGNNSSVVTWNKDGSNKLTLTHNFGTGTKENSVTKCNLLVTTSSALRTELAKVFPSSSSFYTKTNTYKLHTSTTNPSSDFIWYYMLMPSSNSSGVPSGLFGFCSEETDYEVWETNNTQLNKLIPCLKACSVDFVVTIKTELASGDVYTKDYNVNVLDSSLKIAVTNVGVDKSDVDF